MNADNLAAWSVDSLDFPIAGTVADKARFAVRYAILAPSSHNTQPWRFVIIGSELLACADRTRSLPNIDPFDRELIISCGAASSTCESHWRISIFLSRLLSFRTAPNRTSLLVLPFRNRARCSKILGISSKRFLNERPIEVLSLRKRCRMLLSKD